MPAGRPSTYRRDVDGKKVIRGFDIMENWYVIREYIKKTYKISDIDIDVLLYFFPKHAFTKSEYQSVSFSNQRRFYLHVKKRFIKVKAPHENKAKTIYGFSDKGSKLVRSIYYMLSGEWKVEVNRALKVHDRGEKGDALLNLIERLNSSTPPDTKKAFYEQNNPS